MNILILGGAGFLGNNLVRKCLGSPKNRVTVIDSLDPKLKSTTFYLKPVWKQIKFIKGDMGDALLMDKAVKNQQVIFNCAAQSSHPLSLADPIFDAKINCLGNLTLLTSVKKNNPKAQIIYASSSTVIGKSSGNTVNEIHAEHPLDIYSANKGVAEKYYRIYHNVFNIRTLSLRFANLYGPFGKADSDFGFINYFISLAHHGLSIPVYGNGRQERNIMYVEDAVNLMYTCIDKPKLSGNIYFAVHREHYSVIEIAKKIITVFGKGRIKKITWPKVRQKVEIGNVNIQAVRLFRETGFKPVYTLTDGLKKTKTIMEKAQI